MKRITFAVSIALAALLGTPALADSCNTAENRWCDAHCAGYDYSLCDIDTSFGGSRGTPVRLVTCTCLDNPVYPTSRIRGPLAPQPVPRFTNGELRVVLADHPGSCDGPDKD